MCSPAFSGAGDSRIAGIARSGPNDACSKVEGVDARAVAGTCDRARALSACERQRTIQRSFESRKEVAMTSIGTSKKDASALSVQAALR